MNREEEGGVEAEDEDPPFGLISLTAGDRPNNSNSGGGNYARKLTNGSGVPSRQSEITFSATAVGNRLARRFVTENDNNNDQRLRV